MNKPLFTPGPWQLTGIVEGSRDYTISVGRICVASVHNAVDFCQMLLDEAPYQQAANAHLIAAAPELYEAATRALSSLNSVLRHRNAIVNFGCIEYERDMLVAALSKARGET